MNIIFAPPVAPLPVPLLTAIVLAHVPHSRLAQDSFVPALTAQLGRFRTTLTTRVAGRHDAGLLPIRATMDVLDLHGTGGRTMLGRWRAAGLLRPSTPRTALTVDSVISLALTRALWPLERVHLPDIPPTEPAWWCWRQDAPDAPILPCPVPLPADVPPTARLWSPWAGAPWIDARIAYDDTAP